MIGDSFIVVPREMTATCDIGQDTRLVRPGASAWTSDGGTVRRRQGVRV